MAACWLTFHGSFRMNRCPRIRTDHSKKPRTHDSKKIISTAIWALPLLAASWAHHQPNITCSWAIAPALLGTVDAASSPAPRGGPSADAKPQRSWSWTDDLATAQPLWPDVQFTPPKGPEIRPETEKQKSQKTSTDCLGLILGLKLLWYNAFKATVAIDIIWKGLGCFFGNSLGISMEKTSVPGKSTIRKESNKAAFSYLAGLRPRFRPFIQIWSKICP